MAEYTLMKTCYHCHGNGEVPDYPDHESGPPSGTETCPVCGGVGKVSVYSFSEDYIDYFTDLLQKINQINNKCDQLLGG